jgi:hypothetical protein
MVGNIDNWCLYQKTADSVLPLDITTYEEAFDAMWSIDHSLGHPQDFRKKKFVMDKKYFKIPDQCIPLFLQLCQLCFSTW